MKFLGRNFVQTVIPFALITMFVLLFCVAIASVLNPIAYNQVLQTWEDRSGVHFTFIKADEPYIHVGICPMQDGDRLYYDDETKEWQTSQGCIPASVEQDGESFVSLSSNSIYQFEVVEASGTDSHFSSMTLAPFCDLVIEIGEEVTAGIQLHYGCDTELGVDGDSVFTVEYTPTLDFEF